MVQSPLGFYNTLPGNEVDFFYSYTMLPETTRGGNVENRSLYWLVEQGITYHSTQFRSFRWLNSLTGRRN